MVFTMQRSLLQRLPLLNIVAVVALVGAGLAAWNIWQDAQITEPVVVAASAIPRGTVIASSDLATFEMKITGETRKLVFGGSSLSSLVGQRTARDVPAGALLSTVDLAQGPLLEADETAVTLSPNRGTVYPALRAGDEVAVLTWEDRPTGREIRVLFEAIRVMRVDTDPFTVTLAVPRAGVTAFGAAATSNRVWLTFLGSGSTQ